MKVLVVARLFSGLTESAQSGVWAPSGVPAIYKLLEALASDGTTELKTVLTVKDDLGDWGQADRTVAFPAVGSVKILGAPGGGLLGRLGLAGKWREILHMMKVLFLVLRWRPDVCYVTNANFIAGSMIARLRLSRVVMRFLGLHPVQKRIAEDGGGFQAILYRAPFAHAVCSLDGSGGKKYLPKLLSSRVPITVLLNGVDRIDPDPDRVRELKKAHDLGTRPVVLFVGRLEPNKGILEFVDACGSILADQSDAMDVLIAGDGSQMAAARERAKSERIRFLGAVEHRDVAALLSLGDIYVSLNRFGSLSNANLEAARAGLCLVTLAPDLAEGTDVESLDVFPEGTVFRIDRDDIQVELTDTLRMLLSDPSLVDGYRSRIRETVAGGFRTWDERISDEIELLRSVA